MRRRTFSLALATLICLAGAGRAAQAQRIEPVMAGDGWEAFTRVQYEGGLTGFSRPLRGVSVATDSTIAFHRCSDRLCERVPRNRQVFADSAEFVFRLAELKGIEARVRTVGPGVGRRVMFGVLANDRSQETLHLQIETDSSAEAPRFVTGAAHAEQIGSKLRFRMKRLGLEIRE